MRPLSPSPARAARSGTRSRSGSTADLGPGAEKRSSRFRDAWPEVKRLLHRHRRSLALGLLLMVFNRLAGLVLPGTTKFLIDDVVGQGKMELLLPLAGVAALATLVQAGTGFGLAQVVSVAGQRAIAEMREAIQAHVVHLPVSYFDSTKSGVLISRVMSDAQGIRNLVGTGIINLVGGFFTAIVAAGLPGPIPILPLYNIQGTAFVDAGLAWNSSDCEQGSAIGCAPVFEWDAPLERTPVVSAGFSTRLNLMGFAVLEAYWAYPFQRPEKGGHIGFNLAPGW